MCFLVVQTRVDDAHRKQLVHFKCQTGTLVIVKKTCAELS